MNLDKFLKFFVPKDKSFFPLFEASAQNMVRASVLLQLLMNTEDWKERKNIIKQIRDVDLVGDEITHTIYDQLNKSFITPFDREDIHELASNINYVVDAINGTSQRFQLYKLKIIIPVFKDLAKIVYKATIEIEIAVNGLRDAGANRGKIIKSCNNLSKLENKADEIYHSGISKLFRSEKEAIKLIKKKEILETLERCTDKTEDVSDTIKGIIIKMV